MTPIPTAASFEALNAMLAERCRARQGDRAGRHASTIGERLVADLAALRALPAVPLEPCEKRAARVSSTALVRYRCNDYETRAVIELRGSRWTARMLLRAVMKDSRWLRRSMAALDLNAGSLLRSSDPDEDDRTVTGILTTLRAGAFVNLRPLAWAWDDDEPRERFSVKRWLAPDYEGPRTVIVQYSPLYETLSILVAGGLIRRIATRLADPQVAIDPARRVVLALDEFHLLKVEGLPTALAVGREKGLVVIAGIQGYSQLRDLWGTERMQVLLDLFQIKIFGRLIPGEGANEIARSLGTRLISALVENRTPGPEDKRAYIEERTTREVFGAERLAGELGVMDPDGAGRVVGLVHAFGQCYLLEWPFTRWVKKREGFIPAAWLGTLDAGAPDDTPVA